MCGIQREADLIFILLKIRKKTAKHFKSAQQIHDEQLAQRIREAWTILERLVNQNIYDDIGKITNKHYE